ncbi:MAG: DMT family transporter [Parvibaculales bacterium]
MTAYLSLFGAIAFEVTGTLLLPATQNFTKLLPTAGLIICYALSFYCLTFVIQKLPLAVVYASWSGLGVFTIAVLSYVFYKETLSIQALLGLFLIIVGVTLVNLNRA